jgi:hypothetical protein
LTALTNTEAISTETGAAELQARHYAETFAGLTPDRVDYLCTLLADEVHFRDPFNDLYGPASVKALLNDMFERTGKPGFELLEVCWHEANRCAWLRWQFAAQVPVIGELKVEGSSRIRLDETGRVAEHLDYWDSAPVYLQLPLIGSLLRRIKRKMALPPAQ